MDNTSPLTALGCALANAIVDPNTPKPLLDSLILFVAQVRDALPLEKTLSVYAAEAEAVISAFASPGQSQSQSQPPAETLHDGFAGTSAG